MPKFEIGVKTSGVNLGVYEAPTADEAVELMAQDAGYKSYRDMCSITDPEDLDEEIEKQRSDLAVTRLDK